MGRGEECRKMEQSGIVLMRREMIWALRCYMI